MSGARWVATAVTAVALSMAGLPAGAAAPASGVPARFWEALYRDSAPPAPHVLDLTLDGSTASARLLLPDRARTLEGTGTWGTDGAVDLTLRDSSGRALGALHGHRSQAPNDDGAAFAGRLTLDGTVTTLAMVRFAQVVRWDVVEGPIHVALRYPRFEAPDLAGLNAVVETRERAQLDAFLQEGRNARANGELFHAWELMSQTRLEGLVGNTVSLLTDAYRYTGGAHGNTDLHTATWQLDGPSPRALSLDALFRPGSAFTDRLEPIVLSALREQDATWVLDGEVTHLTRDDLAHFDLTPAGLAFHFPPYAMGPYVQGTFTVVVPYAAVLDLARADGPLRAYAASSH